MPEKGLLPLAKDIINTCCDVQLLTCHASNLCKLRASCPNLPLAPRPCPQLRSSLLQLERESAPSALSSWAVNYCRRNSGTRGVCVIILHATPPFFLVFSLHFFCFCSTQISQLQMNFNFMQNERCKWQTSRGNFVTAGGDGDGGALCGKWSFSIRPQKKRNFKVAQEGEGRKGGG